MSRIMNIRSQNLNLKIRKGSFLNEIMKLQSNYDKKFEKIIIFFIDKLCEFDLLNNTYNIIENTNKQLNNISIKTHEKLSNQ